MKVHVDFTVEIDDDYLGAMRALAGDVDTIGEIRAFVQTEAQDYLLMYLDGGQVRARLARNNLGEGTAYAW